MQELQPRVHTDAIIEFINIIDAHAHADFLASRKSAACFLNEHTVPANKRESLNHKIRLGREMRGLSARRTHLGPLDQTAKRPTAGVGAISNTNDNLIPLPVQTEAFETFHDQGRAIIYAYAITPNTCLLVCVLYCYTGAHENHEQAAKTDELFRAAFLELAHHPDIPTIICTDLNADPDDIPILKDAICEGKWHDIGSDPTKTTSQGVQNTCFNHNSQKGTRRDYVFADPIAYNSIDSFQALRFDEVPVHALLQVRLNLSIHDLSNRKLATTPSLSQIFEDYIAKLVGENFEEAQTIRSKATQALHEHLDAYMDQHCDDEYLSRLTLEQHWRELNKYIVQALTTFFGR